MAKRRIYDSEGHAQFVTFSCYHRRRLLDHDRCKRIVIGTLGSQLAQQNGICIGFVVMPDHVHALVWFQEKDQLSHFMKQWKQRSSVAISQFVQKELPEYAQFVSNEGHVWQPKYYPFNVFSDQKAIEKLDYMHWNPVHEGLAEQPVEWPWNSARWYELGQSVGVPIGWVS
jgi:putative transposase